VYFNIHSGSCAPAERDLPSLATIFSQALRARPSYWVLSRACRRSSSQSLVCCVRIEDHGLLADLYFAVPEGAGALVDVQDGTGGGQLCVDKSEAARDRAFAEQALAGADNHGELPDAQRIDEIVLE
jgi:hypothetical protein